MLNPAARYLLRLQMQVSKAECQSDSSCCCQLCMNFCFSYLKDVQHKRDMSGSLSGMLKSHKQKYAETKRQNEHIKKSAIQSTKCLTDSLNDHLNEGVTEMFSKQKQLEQHSKKLSNQIAQYTNQTQQWLSLVDDFNNSMKEMGDVKNWAEIMEQDMKAIMATLEFVHSGTLDESTE